MRISYWSPDVCSSDLIEERARLRAVDRAALGEHAHVAAGAEAASLGVVDHHRLDAAVTAPFDKGGDHRRAHILGQRMYSLRPIEPDPPDLAFDFRDHIAHGQFRSPAKAEVQFRPLISALASAGDRVNGRIIASAYPAK